MNNSEKKLNSLHNSLMRDPALFEPAEFSATESEKTGASGYSYWRSTLRTFFKSKAVIALCILVSVILLMSFLYPLISPVDPTKVSINPLDWNHRPSFKHPFGTDALGRDIFARAWYGCRNSFILAFSNRSSSIICMRFTMIVS